MDGMEMGGRCKTQLEPMSMNDQGRSVPIRTLMRALNINACGWPCCETPRNRRCAYCVHFLFFTSCLDSPRCDSVIHLTRLFSHFSHMFVLTTFKHYTVLVKQTSQFNETKHHISIVRGNHATTCVSIQLIGSSKKNLQQKPLSSNLFHQKQLSSKTIFIKNQFHQRPLPVRGSLCESVAGRRPATPSHKHGLCPPLDPQQAFLLNIAGPAMFNRKAGWNPKGGCLGFRFYVLGFRV